MKKRKLEKLQRKFFNPAPGTKYSPSPHYTRIVGNGNKSATNLLQKKIEGVDYKKAQLSTRGGDLKKRWYVYFYLWSDSDKKFVRPAPEYISNKQFPTADERITEGMAMVDFINELLASGEITLKSKAKPETELSISEKSFTIEQAVDVALEATKNDTDVSERTYYGYELTLLRFLKFCKKRKFETLDIKDLNKSMCLEFMSTYKNIKGKTYNIYLGDIRAVMKRLVDLEIIDINPFALLKNRKVIKLKKQIWQDEERLKYFNWVKDNEPGMYLIGRLVFYACVRPVEITRIKASFFQLDKFLLLLPGDASKNKRPDPVTINKDLAAELKQYLKGVPGDYYIFSKNLKPGPEKINRKVITDRFYWIRKKLGIPFEIKHYSLKHTFNSKMVEKKVDIYALSKHNRHHDIRQTMDYVTDLQIGADHVFLDPGV